MCRNGVRRCGGEATCARGKSAGRKSKEVLKQPRLKGVLLMPNLLIPICCCSLQLSCRIAAYASTQFMAIVPERRGRTGTMCIAKEKNGRICAQAKWAEKMKCMKSNFSDFKC